MFTTTVIVPPNGIITLSGDVQGGTQTISGPTSTVFITSTVTNTNPTTLVATATSAVQRREARIVQHHHDHGKDDYVPTSSESSYGSDGDERHGYGESVDGTWYPVMGSKSAAAAAFSRLRALPNASRSFVCSCLEKHAAIYSPSPAPPALTKTATVTSTDEDLPLIPTATVDVRWTHVSFTVQTTTVTSTKVSFKNDFGTEELVLMGSQTTEVFSGPTIACIADPSSNILVNGGFDDNPGNEWHEVDPTPWGYAGRGWGPMFDGPVPDAQTPSNYAFFPGDDDGATFRIWQDSTNLDIRQNYTVSFWYKLSGLTSKPYNPDGRGPCPFSVTWGGFTIFAKDFDQGDASSEWKHVNSPIDLSPQSSSARLEFDLYCDPEWLGEGSVLLFIDSVAIYPSSGLVCDEAT
ncbi:hypothetical protein KJ359_005925 [Pestalotiopsis sp. 9143b]|nr:hypothetical protein KJ359_005925 [Pestalotiopsis sp. 9143b]